MDSAEVVIAMNVCKEMEGSDVLCVLPTAFYSRLLSWFFCDGLLSI